MPKSKTEMMQKLRAARKAAGLISLTVWIRPEHKNRLKHFVSRLLKEKPE